MLDPAVQPRAEIMEAPRTNAAATDSRPTGDQVESGRRYTAEDFRSLMARLSKGAAARPNRPRPAAAPVLLPKIVPWRQRCAAAAVAEQHSEAEPNAVSQAPAACEGEQDPLPQEGLSAVLAPAETESAEAGPTQWDDTQPAEAQPTATLIADPLPQEGLSAVATPAETEPAETGPTQWDDAQPAEAQPADPLPQADHSPVLEPAETESTDTVTDSSGAEDAETAVPLPNPAVAATDAALEPDLQSAETARTLLDIMAKPSGVQPQERALAGDTLLRLVSRMPVGSLMALCDRLCIMEAPPPLLVRRLIHHENSGISGPLLEKCPGISDQDLMTMINMGDVATLRLIARRRHLSPALTDALIRHGDASVMLTVVRNPGAALSHEAFNVLAEMAKSRTSLQAPLATRPDTPAPIAFELFWSLPPQLRRYVLSRFLTESATLDRILKIAHALEDSNAGDASGSPKIADKAEIEELVALVADGKTTEACQKLTALAGIGGVNAERIITDSEGEPLTVAMKAIGLSRTQFAAVAETLRDAPAAPLRSNRRIGELQSLFDSLSFTKARVLLTYWDWAVEQSGPYSGKAV